MTTHDVHHLAAAYALNALDPEERREFEAHYPTCSICVDEVTSFRIVAAHLAEGVQAQPPEELKTKIMGEVLQTRQMSPLVPEPLVDLSERRRADRGQHGGAGQRLILVGAAAALVLIAGLAFFGFRTSDTERVLAAPDAVVTVLEGESGSVTVVWSDELDQVAIIGNGMPETGPNAELALWFVRADGVSAAGLFDSDDGVVRTVLDVDDAEVSGWGITIEPNGGSPQPTSDILFVGTF